MLDTVIADGRLQQCRRDVWDVDRGNLNAVLACGPIPTRVAASYDADSFHAQVERQFPGLTVRDDIEGRRVGECPA